MPRYHAEILGYVVVFRPRYSLIVGVGLVHALLKLAWRDFLGPGQPDLDKWTSGQVDKTSAASLDPLGQDETCHLPNAITGHPGTSPRSGELSIFVVLSAFIKGF